MLLLNYQSTHNFLNQSMWNQELKLFNEINLISHLGLVMKLNDQFQIFNSNSSNEILKS